MSTPKRSLFFALILLTRLCATHAVRGGPRGGRRLQGTVVPVTVLVQGRPELTFDHLIMLQTVFMDTYNISPSCVLNNVVLDGVEYTGTGIQEGTFSITGTITTTSGASLFTPETTTGRSLSSKSGKSNSYEGYVPAPYPTNLPRTSAPVPSPTSAPSGSSRTEGCLTQSAFVSFYNEAVKAHQVELDYSIDQVLNVLVEEYGTDDCGEFTYFEEDLIMSFTGDPSLSTLSQLVALEESFIKTYNVENSYNLDTCDPFFREVDSVDLITSGSRQLSDRNLQTRFNYRYRVKAKCRGGCTTNSRLFGDASGRRLFARELQDTSCVCPVEATELRAPTVDEFQASYSASIEVLKTQGVINNAFIQTLSDITEEGDKTDSVPTEPQPTPTTPPPPPPSEPTSARTCVPSEEAYGYFGASADIDCTCNSECPGECCLVEANGLQFFCGDPNVHDQDTCLCDN